MPVLFTTTAVFSRAQNTAEALSLYGVQVESVLSKQPITGRVTPEMLQQALMERAEEIEYLVTGVSPIRREFLERARNLKLVAMFGTGVDHIDIPAATEHGVLVTHAVGGNARSVAELVMGLMLSLARYIPDMHQGVCSGAWKRHMGRELGGRTLGIVGLGAIGREVAKLAGAFGMRLMGAMRHPDTTLAAQLNITLRPLEEILPQVDYLSLHIPGGTGKPLIGVTELAMMQKSACLINTARGSLVDLDALYEALNSGALAGAGLDVFPQEPVDGSHPIFRLANLVAAPHAGALTVDAQENVRRMCLEEVGRVLAGQRSSGACNPEVYAAWGWQ